MSRQDCPVQREALGVLESSRELVRRMRRLRRSLQACRRCSTHSACRFQQAFQARVDAAIAEVAEEWGLNIP